MSIVLTEVTSIILRLVTGRPTCECSLVETFVFAFVLVQDWYLFDIVTEQFVGWNALKDIEPIRAVAIDQLG